MDASLPPSEGPAPIIETRQLTCAFRELVAVDHLDLAVPPGLIFGLLGANGAGKSTTIKMLITLLRPTGGSARVAGFDVVREAREVRRRIGYVSQLLSADGALTGFENLMLFAKLYELPRRERRARIEEALGLMGLTEAADKLASHYSGGMLRRLEIAQSMLHRPEVLFLDEATIGLDPVARRVVWEQLRTLRARFGTTVLMTTHDMEEAAALCDTIAIMRRGRLAALGTPSELEAQVGPGASLDDVFVHFTGNDRDGTEDFANVRRTRRAANRLG